MNQIQRWRDNISWLVATITVALSYELRRVGLVDLPIIENKFAETFLPFVAATVILLGSLIVARVVTKWAVSSPKVRAWIMGTNFVEGYWYLKTMQVDSSDTSPLAPDGVLWLRYDPNENQYAVTTTRLKPNGERYEVPSKLIHMRRDGQLLLYVNYFVISDGGSHAKEGVSKGFFSVKGEASKAKDRFDAYVFSEDETSRHQWAVPIARVTIKECVKEAENMFPNDLDAWKNVFLLRQMGINPNA